MVNFDDDGLDFFELEEGMLDVPEVTNELFDDLYNYLYEHVDVPGLVVAHTLTPTGEISPAVGLSYCIRTGRFDLHFIPEAKLQVMIRKPVDGLNMLLQTIDPPMRLFEELVGTIDEDIPPTEFLQRIDQGQLWLSSVRITPLLLEAPKPVLYRNIINSFTAMRIYGGILLQIVPPPPLVIYPELSMEAAATQILSGYIQELKEGNYAIKQIGRGNNAKMSHMQSYVYRTN